MYPSRSPTGSTHSLYPEGFLDDMKVLELGGVGSRALPNGLRELRDERPYQVYYDQKYYIKEAPAPAPAPAAAPSSRANKLRPAASPMPSPAGSAMSLGASSIDQHKEKKKKGLFRF